LDSKPHPRPRWIDGRFALLTACVAAAVVFGSLFPFQYRASESPLAMLLATTSFRLSTGETVANVLFYIPLGMAAAAALSGVPLWAKVILAGLGGSLFSLCMELAQAHSVGRVPNVFDFSANSSGAFLGAATSAIYSRAAAASFWGHARNRPFVWLLLADWVGYQLLAPTTPGRLVGFSPLNLVQDCVVWLAIALLLEALVGAARSRVALATFTVSLLLLDAILSGFVVPLEQGVSAAIVVLLWSAVIWKMPKRGIMVAMLFVIYVALVALRPFHFLSTPRHFELMPFISFVNGARDAGARSFLEKAFTYGALVWLLARAGWKLGRAALVSVTLVLILRILQVYLPGRSAEITDAMLTLAMAGLMKLLREDPSEDQLQASGDATNRYPMPRTVTR
jgi:VanZ family protein